MSDHALPDDLNLWPKDPFKLLGLSGNFQAIEARRSYLRLVKIFKPEHHPDAFQRLRSAYEQVQEYLAWQQNFGGMPEAGDEFEWPATDDDSKETLHSEAVEFQPTQKHRSKNTVRDPSDEIWQEFKSGSQDNAYQKLIALRYATPNFGPICLRLYWMLWRHPELDRERTARDWLVDGIKGCGMSSGLDELYRRELFADPGEAATSRCESLIHCDMEHSDFRQFLRWRWQGLFRTGKSNAIAEDMEHVRERFKFDAEEAWIQILALALDHLAWFHNDPKGKEAFHRYLDELSATHCDPQVFDSLLDRVDELVMLTKNWGRLHRGTEIPLEWIELIPYAWLGLSEIVIPATITMMQSIVSDPFRSLQTLDQLNHISQLGFFRIHSLLRARRPYHLAEERSPKELDRIVSQFLTLHWFKSAYQPLRIELLKFCVREAISPDEVGQCCQRLAQTGIDTLNASEEFHNDLPLRAVYVAHEALQV